MCVCVCLQILLSCFRIISLLVVWTRHALLYNIRYYTTIVYTTNYYTVCVCVLLIDEAVLGRSVKNHVRNSVLCVYVN